MILLSFRPFSVDCRKFRVLCSSFGDLNRIKWTHLGGIAAQILLPQVCCEGWLVSTSCLARTGEQDRWSEPDMAFGGLSSFSCFSRRGGRWEPGEEAKASNLVLDVDWKARHRLFVATSCLDHGKALKYAHASLAYSTGGKSLYELFKPDLTYSTLTFLETSGRGLGPQDLESPGFGAKPRILLTWLYLISIYTF